MTDWELENRITALEKRPRYGFLDAFTVIFTACAISWLIASYILQPVEEHICAIEAVQSPVSTKSKYASNEWPAWLRAILQFDCVDGKIESPK